MKNLSDYDEDWLPTEADWKRMEEEDKKGMYPRLQASPAAGARNTHLRGC